MKLNLLYLTRICKPSRIGRQLRDRTLQHYAEIAQLVEHATENRRVDSSSLSLGISAIQADPAGVVQLVERLLAKEKVTSSNLVARSFLPGG